MNNEDRSMTYQSDVRDDNDPRRYFIDWIDKDDPKILDVGCATGDFAVALSERKTCKIWGIEYNAGSVKIAKSTGAFVDVFQIDLNFFSVEKFSDFQGFFDYIVFGDILEHIQDPLSIVEQFKTLLKKGGLLLLSIPNVAHSSIKGNILLNNFDYTEYGILDKTHIKFFTHKTICAFLGDLRLSIAECRFTFWAPTGSQINNPFDYLNPSVNRHIFKDKHSYVWQYVVKCAICEAAPFGENFLKLSNVKVPNDFLLKAYKYSVPMSLRIMINFITFFLSREKRHRFKAGYILAKECAPSPLISDQIISDPKPHKKIAVHFHISYYDMLDYFSAKIKNLDGIDYDLFISTHLSCPVDSILHIFPQAEILIVENRGYDIYPFIEFLNKVDISNYDFILKLHTKSIVGYGIRNSLVESLCGSKKTIENNINLLKNNQNIGMIGDNGSLCSDDDSCNQIKEILNGMGLTYAFNENKFIAGSIFLVRSKILEPLRHRYSAENFEYNDPTIFYGTFAHTMERLLGNLVIAQGYEIYGNNDYRRSVSFYEKERGQASWAIKIFGKTILKKNCLHLQTNISLFNCINFSFRSSSKDIKDMFSYMLNEKSDFFVDESNEHYSRNEKDVKLIVYYLPQFYRFQENDDWHGKGFTEWTNVTKSLPLYVGHYQPHLPLNGFYTLNTDVMREQVELARKYGIYGFCFYYYWFSGKKLMEKPVFDMLAHPEIDFPFMLCWANENWSKRWDGKTEELLMEQKLEDKDVEKFFADILPFFKDERYIKINGCPLLILYRASFFPQEKLKKFVIALKNLAKANGFNDLYVTTTNLYLENNHSDLYLQNIHPESYGMDAVIEFPPNCMVGLKKNKTKKIVHSSKYIAYDMKDYITKKKFLYECDYKVFKAVFPSWDNSARRAKYGCRIYENETPVLYKKWLKACITYTRENHTADEQMVFINAWNEWAEGAHLEPDRKYGYAYLQATREALEESRG
ncbi:MAG: glycoside hydrolase family 99-like domain-containing protein [Holosporaceae bacterium]|jgi:lipopolysaccharide biosynthesis protein/2-polyprenyl-3-methyl-5-hydroxy-6-metoxy-1,4-benzoquinol methylase|nr:glycoside hydrolase family 99-like domain-containing protein [Holosporaceae bacterium]